MSEALNPVPESQPLWYYADAANQPVGPLPMDALQHLAKAGVIQPETHVIEKGGTEWKRFASVVPTSARAEKNPAPADIALSNAGVSTKENAPEGFKHDSKKAETFFQQCGRGVMAFAVGVLGKCILYWRKAKEFFDAYKRGLKVRAENEQGISGLGSQVAKTKAPLNSRQRLARIVGVGLGLFVVLKVAASFHDWTLSSNRRKAEEVPEILKLARENALKFRNEVLPANYIVMNGQTEKVNSIHVETLSDMIEAIYRGDVSIEAAKRYVFPRKFYGRRVLFDDIVGDFLVFFSDEWRVRRDFALSRNHAFENAHRKGKDMDDYRASLSGFMEDNMENPINEKDGVRIVGFETFKTGGGLLKEIPVVETVTIPKR